MHLASLFLQSWFAFSTGYHFFLVKARGELSLIAMVFADEFLASNLAAQYSRLAAILRLIHTIFHAVFGFDLYLASLYRNLHTVD